MTTRLEVIAAPVEPLQFPPFASVDEFAKIANISTWSVRQCIRKGMPHTRRGGPLRVCVWEAIAWLKEPER